MTNKHIFSRDMAEILPLRLKNRITQSLTHYLLVLLVNDSALKSEKH